MSDFEEPDNGSTINKIWMNFSRWYEFQKEGLTASFTKTKEGIKAFFIYRRKF